MTALEAPLRAAGFSLRGLGLALPETGTPRGLKPAARFILDNPALSYYGRWAVLVGVRARYSSAFSGRPQAS